jgi:hypothetical protein
MAKAFILPASEEGHHAPSRTIMQGSVEDGFDGGYEERDVQFAPLFMWSAGILGLVIFTLIFVAGGMHFMLDQIAQEEAKMPAVMAVTQDPPEPRVLPNRIDSAKRPGMPLQMPYEWGEEKRDDAKEVAAEHGLFDKNTGLPYLPKESIDAVMRSSGGAPTPGSDTVRPQMDGTSYELPSDSSGGVRMENKLK